MKITGAYGGASYNLSISDSDKNKKELGNNKKVNSLADDISNTSIFQRMETKSKEFGIKLRNLQSEISMYQVMDTGLNEINEKVNQLKELANKVENMPSNEKMAIKEKANAILEEINNISNKVQFNNKKVLENFSTEKLGLVGEDIANKDLLTKIDKALEGITKEKKEINVKMNNAQEEIAKTTVANENSMAAISKIADADMLVSIMNNTRSKILQEANNAVNIQSKISQQRVIDILKE